VTDDNACAGVVLELVNIKINVCTTTDAELMLILEDPFPKRIEIDVVFHVKELTYCLLVDVLIMTLKS